MMRIIKPRAIEIFVDDSGKAPFLEWLNKLDQKTRARIRNRLVRMEMGDLGDYAPVGDGVFELRMFFGSGYRVYFGETDNTIVLILCGGDKKLQ